MYNITDLTAGFYIVEVTVSIHLVWPEPLQWTLSTRCWTPITTGLLHAQPPHGLTQTRANHVVRTSYDEDDDNDGFSDSKDAFPLDPCAQIDTDGDTQPDDLDCPDGYTSWLTEDMDDDGDGTPDVLEGVESNDDDVNVNGLMVVLALFLVCRFALLCTPTTRRTGRFDLA